MIVIGISLIYDVLGFLNIAHGSFYMLSIFLAYSMVQFTNFIVVLVLVPIIITGIGMVLEKYVFRKMEGNIGASVIFTTGLMFFMEQIVLMIWGGGYINIISPIQQSLFIFGESIPLYRILLILLAVIILFSFWSFLRKTNYGLKIRAIANNRMEAASIGINIDLHLTMFFGICILLTSIGSVLAAPTVGGFYLMDVDFVILAFIVFLVGGPGSIKGTIVASLLVVFSEYIIILFASPVIGRTVSLSFLIAVLVFKPEGIYPGEI